MNQKNAETYYEQYKNAGFHFPTSVLTTYAISLYTKPFLILSGISGTGKTKIAQLFNTTQFINKDATVKPKSELSLKIPKILERFNFSQLDLEDLFNATEKADFEEKAKKFREEKNNGNFTDFYIFKIKDEYGEFEIGVYGQRASSPLIRGRFYKSNRDKKNENYDSRDHIKKYYKQGDVLKLEKTGERELKVISINDKQVKEAMTEHETNTLNRHCFIPVKSDWTDSSDLFGFYNLVEQRYHVPKFLSFLFDAINNPEYSFFVTLDEMNLSKVEHYFSDILSCLESRIFKDGKIHQEKITLYNGISQLQTDCEEFEEIPNEIEIPINLYITGTVNIDESTHMFSQKVLDRANVIEFNEVDLEAYGNSDYIEDETNYKLKIMPNYNEYCLSTKESYEKLSAETKTFLLDINNILQKYNLHFGYRTANETAQYIFNALKYIEKNKEIELIALDHQLVQKIFPKLSGGYAALEPPLRELLLYLSKKEKVSEIVATDTNFSITVSKLLRMHREISVNSYTSFVM